MTRREFARLALAGGSGVAAFSAFSRVAVEVQAQAGANRSLIGGVQFGLQPFCYHDLPMTP